MPKRLYVNNVSGVLRRITVSVFQTYVKLTKFPLLIRFDSFKINVHFEASIFA
jgi:hypothetical protein